MSPRPRKWRHCIPFAGDTFYKPRTVPLSALEIVNLAMDELEAMRLCDLEDMDQEKAAEKMNISRGTIQRLLYAGRKKVADALLNSKAIRIVGGPHVVPPPFGRQRWRFRRRL